MKRFAFLAVLIFFSQALTNAQNEKKPEFFAGYSFESLSSGITSSDIQATGATQTSLDNRFKLNGFNVSGAGYLNKHLAIVGDFSAHFNSRTDFFDMVSTESKLKLYNLSAGPQYKFSSTGRITPFAHALFGIAHRNLTETLASKANYFRDSGTNFAMNLGGGIDYRLNDKFALRVFQIDYKPIFLRSRTFNSVTFPDRTLNGVRISAGIVIR
jgi:opacity protein-like surface antigen